MKFTDIGLFLGSQRLRELLQIGGKTDPARCLQITQALTTAFFDRHLKGQSAEALTSMVTTYPEIEESATELIAGRSRLFGSFGFMRFLNPSRRGSASIAVMSRHG